MERRTEVAYGGVGAQCARNFDVLAREFVLSRLEAEGFGLFAENAVYGDGRLTLHPRGGCDGLIELLLVRFEGFGQEECVLCVRVLC